MFNPRLFTSREMRRAIAGTAASLGSFIVLGTIAAIWTNPFFIRMVPVAGYELPLLAAQSVLLGLYVALRRPACQVRTIGAGSFVGFLGIACPICNKVLMFVFGASALMTYFEPVRLYVGLAGLGLGVLAVVVTLRGPKAPTTVASHT